MNRILVLALGAALVGGATAFVLNRNSPAAAKTPRAAVSSSVLCTAMSDDGKAVFSLAIFEPWSGSDHRSIAFYGSSVSASGLASLAGSRLSEVGAGSEPLSVVGELHTCTASLHGVGAWVEVHEKSQVTLSVTKNN